MYIFNNTSALGKKIRCRLPSGTDHFQYVLECRWPFKNLQLGPVISTFFICVLSFFQFSKYIYHSYRSFLLFTKSSPFIILSICRTLILTLLLSRVLLCIQVSYTSTVPFSPYPIFSILRPARPIVDISQEYFMFFLVALLSFSCTPVYVLKMQIVSLELQSSHNTRFASFSTSVTPEAWNENLTWPIKSCNVLQIFFHIPIQYFYKENNFDSVVIPKVWEF